MIGALILGLVAGFLARALLPGKQDLNFILTIVLGLAGAALGYAFFTLLLGIGDEDAFDLGGLPGALVGALVLLFIYDRVIASRSEKREAPQAVTAGERERSAAPSAAAGERSTGQPSTAESTGAPSPEERAERRERRERERRERE